MGFFEKAKTYVLYPEAERMSEEEIDQLFANYPKA